MRSSEQGSRRGNNTHIVAVQKIQSRSRFVKVTIYIYSGRTTAESASLAEWFKAVDLSSTIERCVSSSESNSRISCISLCILTKL